MRRRPEWWRIRGGAPTTMTSCACSTGFSRTSSWAAARRTFFPSSRCARQAHGRARTTSASSRRPATRSSIRRRSSPRPPLSPTTRKLLGLFNDSNIDGALDRKFLKKGSVDKFPDQPDLTDEMRAALQVLSRGDKGFVLDGRGRPHRQIQPFARLGARRLRHHHVRQRREDRQGFRGQTHTTR